MDGIETGRQVAASDPAAVVVLVSLDDLPPELLDAVPGVAGHLRKQDLSARALRDLWATHGRLRAQELIGDG